MGEPARNRHQRENDGGSEPLKTLPEVCDELRISLHTGRKLVQSGRLPCYRNGGITRFAPRHIQAFLKAENDEK